MVNILVVFTIFMNLTEAALSKPEMLQLAGVNSTTFNNWRIRNYIPFKKLGCEYSSLTRCKYSYLVAAYCASLSYHTGSDRKQYIKLLKTIFCRAAEEGAPGEDYTIAISGLGKGKDCGSFPNYGLALEYGGAMSLYVPVGKIISRARKHQINHHTSTSHRPHRGTTYE